MKIKIYKHTHVEPGPFVTYTIDGRKKPIVELYNLDTGYLVLTATVALGGYERHYYKSNRAAHASAQNHALRYCKYYWDEAEIVPEI